MTADLNNKMCSNISGSDLYLIEPCQIETFATKDNLCNLLLIQL